MTESVVLHPQVDSAEHLASGKVRDLYRLGDDLLLVTSDRVSAYDVVMAQGIPGKGRVLTAVSAFWFERLRGVVDNHMLSTDVDAWDDLTPRERELLRGRSMRCRSARPLPVEWVVRGYLTGSGWKDYQAEGRVSGVLLPTGLQHASALDPPILTPSTKAESGHDVPIGFEKVVDLVGREVACQARDAALALYAAGQAYARERGIVIADTKFEFGMIDDALVLIDECLTPDSSRFWAVGEVHPGGQPTSFDKQVLRDWLTESGWNRTPPPPALPPEVAQSTAATYSRIEHLLTGVSSTDFPAADLPVADSPSSDRP